VVSANSSVQQVITLLMRWRILCLKNCSICWHGELCSCAPS
jgi:hypothetical protein